MEFKRALESLNYFDTRLKEVYSYCVDLYVWLDKDHVIKTEKKLNDCILDFQEIKEKLLENLK